MSRRSLPASTTTTKPKRGEGAAHAGLMLAIVLATLLAGTVLLMTMLAVINL
jgi:hypothetical protein